MQRREFLGLSIAAGLSAAGLPGCSDSGPLRFGIHPWIGYEPLYLAGDFNWLPATVALLLACGGLGGEGYRREGWG